MKKTKIIKTGLVSSDIFLQHQDTFFNKVFGDKHPENPNRVLEAVQHLKDVGTWKRLHHIPIRTATLNELLLVHTQEHINQIRDACQGQSVIVSSESYDTYISNRSFYVSCCCVGSLISLAEQVIKDELTNGVAIFRPPGHHATADKVMGYCLLNNIAITAKAIHTMYPNISRILIVDWDLHHGNGIEKIFYEDSTFLYISIHLFLFGDFYPGTGHSNKTGGSNARGHNVNIALNSTGLSDKHFMKIFEKIVIPISKEYDPHLIFVACGFDAARGDSQGYFNVTSQGFAFMTDELKKLASGRVILALEGGYNPTVVSLCMDACIRTLLGDDPRVIVPHNEPSNNIQEDIELIKQRKKYIEMFSDDVREKVFQHDIETVMDFQRPYWICFFPHPNMSISLQNQKDISKNVNFESDRKRHFSEIESSSTLITHTHHDKNYLNDIKCKICNNTASGKCPYCRSIFYCSRYCQCLDWMEHQKQCSLFSSKYFQRF